MRITGYESNQMILEELGQRMKDTRIAANYSQAEMAERSGVALSTLARMERGESVTKSSISPISPPDRAFPSPYEYPS